MENHVALAAEQSRESHSSTAAHTPGPWSTTIVKGEWWIGSDDRNVAVVLGEAEHPLNEADARLIAAAPDMLEALRRAGNALVDVRPLVASSKDESWAYFDHVIDAVNAVVAKAEGRS